MWAFFCKYKLMYALKSWGALGTNMCENHLF